MTRMRCLRRSSAMLVTALAAATLASGAADAQSGAPSRGAPTPSITGPRDPVAAARDSTITTLLTGPLGSRSPTGSATLAGRTVRVTIADDRPGVSRGWHVHRGTCGRTDGAVPAASGYQPIAIDARGAGSASATLAASLAPDTGYALDVHDTSPGAALDAIACGVLTQPPAAAGGPGGDGSGEAGMNDMAGMPGTATMHDMATAAGGNSSSVSSSASTAAPADSLASLLIAVYDRMMADPVISERAATDPVLRRLVARLAATRGAAGSAMPHDSASMPGTPGMAMPSGGSKGATTNRGATKPAPKKPAPKKPAPAKPAPTPARPKMPPGMKMPGMDHEGMGHMPGMRTP